MKRPLKQGVPHYRLLKDLYQKGTWSVFEIRKDANGFDWMAHVGNTKAL